jgi:hypothetical protein
MRAAGQPITPCAGGAPGLSLSPRALGGQSAAPSGTHRGIPWVSGAMPRPQEAEKDFLLQTGSMGRLAYVRPPRGPRPLLTEQEHNHATSQTTV